MEPLIPDLPDNSHFWIACPGCGYGGEIGVPTGHPSDVVVCPQCREVVHVRPEQRILWRPLSADEFIARRFPSSEDDENCDQEPSANSEVMADLTSAEPKNAEPLFPRLRAIAAFAIIMAISFAVVASLVAIVVSR